MNTKVIIAVVVVILLGGGGYMAYTTMQPSQGPADSVNSDTSGNGMMKSSFNALLAAGQNVKCTFSQNTSEGTQSGTTYIAGGKMRSDMQVVGSAQGNYAMHVINDGDYGYIWGGPTGETTGIKMKMDVAANANVNAQTQQNVDWDQQMDFDCDPWAADTSLLTPPTSVTFNDMSNFAEMMQGANSNTNTTGSVNVNVNANVNVNGSGSVDNSKCSLCDNLPSEAKKECREAFGC